MSNKTIAVKSSLLFWTALWAVDYLLYSLYPLISDRRAIYTNTNWSWTFVLLACFAVTGCILGIAGWFAARMLRDWSSEQFRQAIAGSSGALGALVAAAVLAKHNGSSLLLVSGGALLVSAGVLLSVIRRPGLERLTRFAQPWTGAALIILPQFVFLKLESPWPKTAALLSIGAVAGVALLWRGKRERTLDYRLAMTCAVVCFFLAGTLGLNLIHHATANLGSGRQAGTASGPNVVMIVMDTVRADHTSLYEYGRDTTPNLRELARTSTVYDNAFSVSDITLSTHGSMFTGLYPQQHGAYCPGPSMQTGRPLDAKFETLAEVLGGQGYATIAVAANDVYLRPEWHLDQGFDFYHVAHPVSVREAAPYSIRDLFRVLLGFAMDVQDYDRLFLRAEWVNRDALQLWDATRRGASTFLFLNYMDAHEPYTPPAPFNRRFGSAQSGWTAAKYVDLKEAALDDGVPVPSKTNDMIKALYDDGIAYEDDQIGRLIGELKRRGAYENSLIIVTSDHGEGFGESHAFTHPGSVYQEHIRIPLLVKYPGQHEPQAVHTPVSQIDLMPTVLAAAGIQTPKGLAGIDLRKVNSEPPRTLVSVSYPCLSFRYPRLNRTVRAVISGDLEYIESTKGAREVYDLQRDPLEQHNLYTRADQTSAALSQTLSAVFQSIPTYVPAQLQPAEMKRLHGLGYVR